MKKPNIRKTLRSIFKWIQQGGEIEDWKGPLLIELATLEIYEGETTDLSQKKKRGKQSN